MHSSLPLLPLRVLKFSGIVLTILTKDFLGSEASTPFDEPRREFSIKDWPDMMSTCRMAIYAADLNLLRVISGPIQHPIELYTRDESHSMPAFYIKRFAHPCVATLSCALNHHRTGNSPDRNYIQDFLYARAQLGTDGHYIHLYMSEWEWRESASWRNFRVARGPDGIPDATGLAALIQLKQGTTLRPNAIQLLPEHYNGEYHKICTMSYASFVNDIEVKLTACGIENGHDGLTIESFRKHRQDVLRLEPHLLVVNRGSSLVHPEIFPIEATMEHLRAIVKTLQEKVSNYSILTKPSWTPQTGPTGNSIRDAVNTFSNLSSESFMKHNGFIPTGEGSYNFITCYEEEQKLDPLAYLAPFDISTWVCWGLASGIIAFIMLIIVKKASGLGFFVFSIMVENPRGKELETSTRARAVLVRMFVGLAFLMGTVLGNSYKGILTVGRTIPIPNHRPKFFKDLKEFQIYTEVDPFFSQVTAQEWKDVRENYSSLIPDATANIIRETFMKMFNVSSSHAVLYTDFVSQVFVQATVQNVTKDTRDKIVFLGRRMTFPEKYPDVRIEEAISECGKSAFLDYDSELGSFKPVMRKVQAQRFTRGKESLLQAMRGWEFLRSRVDGGLLKSMLNRLDVESGLGNWLKYHKARAEPQSLAQIWVQQVIQELKLTKERKLSLESNLVKSLFAIWMTLAMTSLLAFALEIVWTKIIGSDTSKKFKSRLGYLCSRKSNAVDVVDVNEFGIDDVHVPARMVVNVV